MTGRIIITGRNSTLPRDVAQMTGGSLVASLPWKKVTGGFNSAAAEDALRRHLDGRFFDVTGEDVNERRRREEAERLKSKSPPMNREKMRERAAALRYARQQLMERRRMGGGYSVRLIIAAVAFAHNVEVEDMVGETRAYPATRARQHAYWLIRKLMNKPYPDIAGYFDRDHTTCIHGCTMFEKRADKYKREIEVVNAMLGIKNPIPA